MSPSAADAHAVPLPGGARSGPTARLRVESIDVLRGVIMILMALDHVRDYFGNAGVDPTDPATATVGLFFTRWVTHFCAPVFFLLTGVGAFLASQRRSQAGMARYLLTRGLWLIVLEVVVLRCLGWQFNVDYRVTVLTVLWALGWSMIVLAGLIALPLKAVVIAALTVVAAHNLLDPIPPAALGSFAPLWVFLHAPGVLFTDGTHLVFAAYPMIPWVAVVAAGWGLGRVFLWEPDRRRTLLVRTGAGLSLGFILLRTLGVDGDPRPWTLGDGGLMATLSFLNTNKYPPSLLFLMMTLGPALLVLAALDRRTPAALRPALVFGRVPLFYFLLHVTVIHLVAVAVCYLRYGDVHWMFESPTLAQFPVTQPPGWPFALPAVYGFWVLVVAMLYPLCRWFGRIRQRGGHWWLSYL